LRTRAAQHPSRPFALCPSVAPVPGPCAPLRLLHGLVSPPSPRTPPARQHTTPLPAQGFPLLFLRPGFIRNDSVWYSLKWSLVWSVPFSAAASYLFWAYHSTKSVVPRVFQIAAAGFLAIVYFVVVIVMRKGACASSCESAGLCGWVGGATPGGMSPAPCLVPVCRCGAPTCVGRASICVPGAWARCAMPAPCTLTHECLGGREA
jgi:hypothetical protein